MNSIAHADISPAFAERNIPVALATDENYLPYLKVTINSAIASSPGSNLDIIVLHAGITEETILDFIAGYAGVDNASVRFVDISDELEASGLSDYKQTDRLPLSSCYRLLLPRILPAYDKIVYIDVDVAVCRDLGELYATDVGDNWFAAAKDVVYNTKPEYVFWAAKWGFAEWDGYVNAGVLVMNLERFRREPVFDRLKEIVFEAAKWNCDQDALNFVCKGAIASLDPRWNVQLGDYCLEKQIAMTGEEMWVAHYTGSQKPWKLPARRYSHLWWRHAAEPDVSCLWTDAWGEALVQPVAGVPKVSVIIPVYNSARYLPEALASVLMQKDIPEIEVICIDDGSTDDSAAILDFWEKRDSRLKIIHQKNQGPGVARNVGLDVAKGEYVFFLDADDRLSSGAALREALEQAKLDRLDVLLAKGSKMLENGKVEKRDVYFMDKIPLPDHVFAPVDAGANLYLVTPMGPAGKLFRRKFLDEQDIRFPALKRSEDFPFIQLALSLAHRIGVCPRLIFDRRIGVATSLESTKDETPLIFAEAERIFRESLLKRRLLQRFERAANVASIIRLDYNLRRIRRFANFKSIAQYGAAEFPKFEIEGDESDVMRFNEACKCVRDIVAVADNSDGLADVFADIQAAKARALLHAKLEKLAVERDTLKKTLDVARMVRDEARRKAAEMREEWDAQRETAAESRLLAPDAALITKVVQTFAEHSVMGFRAVAERAASGEAIGASGEKGARLKEILERRKSNNEELRVKLGKATELAERRKANNAALRERLEKAEEIAERRKGQIGILNGKLVQMSKIAESRKQNNAVLKAKAENADARLKSCGRAISQLEESNREKDAEISSLKSLLDRIESIVGDGEAG